VGQRRDAAVIEDEYAGTSSPLGSLPALTVLFQPILDTITGVALGFESLTRLAVAPEQGFPRGLLEDARRLGTLRSLNEHLAGRAMREFGRSSLPGLLFVNVSPGVMSHEEEGVPFRLEEPALANDRVVIELTEDEPTLDYRLMRESLLYFRERGFTIALDDFGEGFASLRLWSELHPRFVKIDRHFVSGIDRDFMKEQFVEAFQRVASRCGVSLVAEGVETPRELAALRRLGIRYAQGFLLGRPAPGSVWRAQPLRVPVWALEDAPSAAARSRRTPPRTLERLLRRVTPVEASLSVERVFERLENSPELKLLPVTSGERVLGLISRLQLIDRFARPFRRELLGKRRCTAIMDEAPVVVDVGIPLRDLARLVGSAASETSGEGFVVTDAGRYLGVCETKSLMLEITDMEIQAARYANPLTLLPGNVPIDECITEWLAEGGSFHVCYADLDHFKPFNDRYGYLAGDEAIRLTAELFLRHADPARDFVGHVGGDDFVVLFRSPDWLERCRGVVTEFERMVSDLIAPEDLARGMLEGQDRQGRPLNFPLLSLSLAVIGVHDDRGGTREIAAAAAAAKQEAKRMAGTSLFLERRGPFPAAAPRGPEGPARPGPAPGVPATEEPPRRGGGES